MTADSMGHDLTRNDPEQQQADSYVQSPPDVYAARMSSLMASEGVQVWQALMRQNRERAERKRGAA